MVLAGILLLVGIANLPDGYYFLRFFVTGIAVAAVVTELRSGFNFWVIMFAALAVLFNPIVPIVFEDATVFGGMEILSGVIFIIRPSIPKRKLEL